MAMTIDGTPGAGYCIDLHTGITAGTSGMPEVDWDTSGVANLAEVERILGNYHPAGSGPAGYAITGTVAQRAAATQAAIWHYTDGFELEPSENDPVIAANYAAILQAVTDGVLSGFGEPNVSLAITAPAVLQAARGSPSAPSCCAPPPSSVNLTPSAGTTVTDAAGVPLPGPYVDGTAFWLVNETVGQATLTAGAEASVDAGRVFAKGGSQRLILATTVRTAVEAEATAEWVAAPTTEPPTTEPPTTEPHDHGAPDGAPDDGAADDGAAHDGAARHGAPHRAAHERCDHHQPDAGAAGVRPVLRRPGENGVASPHGPGGTPPRGRGRGAAGRGCRARARRPPRPGQPGLSDPTR